MVGKASIYAHLKAFLRHPSLRHPLLLLIVGAFITSFLIPSYTRQWQDHQKELELKADLADQMNTVVSSALIAQHLELNPFYNSNNSAFTNSYKDFQISREIISSKLSLYFADARIARSWDNLSNVLSNLYDIVSSPIARQYGPTYHHVSFSDTMCSRLVNILSIHTSYPQLGQVNIDPNVIKLYNCKNYYYPSLQNTQRFQGHFSVKSGIDWNSLFEGNNSTSSVYSS